MDSRVVVIKRSLVVQLETILEDLEKTLRVNTIVNDLSAILGKMYIVQLDK